jgi:ribonucleotide reductase alpha subunit
MIKFFRNIRQNLLSEGKTGKYFKYAIGEIILVVIGILFALQINNWNQDRNEYKRTKTLLSNLKLDIEENIKYLKDLQKSIEIRKDYADFILNSLDNRKVTDSSMFISAMTRVGWVFNDSQKLPTYTEIISSGNLAYINSENLKNELARYQSIVEEIQQIGIPFNLMLTETSRLAISHLQGMPESSMLIKPVSSYLGISFDLKAIASDTEFYKSVKFISYQSADAISYINDLTITNLERLKILIDDEFKSNDR